MPARRPIASVALPAPPGRGFSLIELLLVLGVVALLLVAAFAIYPQVRDRRAATSDARDLIGMVSAVETVVGVGGNFRGMNNLVVNRAGLVPRSFNGGQRNTAVLTNSFGGTIQLIDTAGGAGGCSTTMCRGLRVDYHGVPSGACQAMIPMLIGKFEWVYARAEGSSTWVIIQRPTTAYTVERQTIACSAGDTVVLLLAT